MTTPPSFPTLTGLGWSVHKKPLFSTIVATHVSGREVRNALYQNPIWQFELTYEGLNSTSNTYPGLGANSLQTLMGFFLQMQGQLVLLYADPTDNTSTNATFANGDGVTRTFTFSRFMGAFLEPVGLVTSISNVFLNTVNGPSGWSLRPPTPLCLQQRPARASDHRNLYIRLRVPV